jgi:hypothetical protein
MPDPVSTTLTASAIASLAFQEFIKSGAGELAKKFTAEAIAKMGELRDLIWHKLRGNIDAESALESAKDGSEEHIADVATYLKAGMKNDQQFATQVQVIAQEINAGKLIDQRNMTMNVHDQARGWQTKVEGGTAYIGEIHQHNAPKPPQQ